MAVPGVSIPANEFYEKLADELMPCWRDQPPRHIIGDVIFAFDNGRWSEVGRVPLDD